MEHGDDPLAAVFAPGGRLARADDGYEYRPAQLEMARAVATALSEQSTLLVEAGTGTGKTYAYLVPVLSSGLRTIVSTATRTLQDQLYARDLPALRKVLASGFTVAMLKGRANYLCRYRLEQTRLTDRVSDRELARQYRQLLVWAATTRSGEISECREVAEDSPLWPRVTSTTDNCLGQGCPMYQECHVVNARRQAQSADLVVVNHHLLCADMALKDTGFGEILPSAQAFVIDEAHQLRSVASQFFGEAVSTRALAELASDTLKEAGLVTAASALLIGPCQALERATKDARLAFEGLAERGSSIDALANAARRDAFEALSDSLRDLIQALGPLVSASAGLEAIERRCQQALEALAKVTAIDSADEIVRWYAISKRHLLLMATPIDISGPFGRFRQRVKAAWVLTSATLAAGDNFGYFSAPLGLAEATTLKLASPFDYQSQGLLYLPSGLPEPQASDYTARVLETTLPVLEASHGRAFLLFTSHRALSYAATWLADRCALPLFVQGRDTKLKLLEGFARSGNGVLLGAASFWEGVDVRGAALSVVVIDKLPFAAPGDPVLDARLKALAAQGLNGFVHHQLPEAMLALKQGIGRLIRARSDTGLLMLCDPRLLSRSYGRQFLSALPPFRQTRKFDEVHAFLSTVVPTAAG